MSVDESRLVVVAIDGRLVDDDVDDRPRRRRNHLCRCGGLVGQVVGWFAYRLREVVRQRAGLAPTREVALAVREGGQGVGSTLCVSARVGVVNSTGHRVEPSVDHDTGLDGKRPADTGLSRLVPVGPYLHVAVVFDELALPFDRGRVELCDDAVDECLEASRRHFVARQQCRGDSGVDVGDGVGSAKGGARKDDEELGQVETSARQYRAGER